MADGGGFANIILPNQFPAPGQVMEQGIQNEQNNTNRYMALMERQREKQQAENLQKTRLIDDATDPKNFQTGLEAADYFSGQQLAKTKQELVDFVRNNPDLSYTDIYGYVQGKVSPLYNNDAALRTKVAQQEALFNQLKKDRPDLKYGKLYEDLMNGIANDYIQKDENGNISGFANVTHLPDRNYLNDLLNPENRANYVTGTNDLIEGIKDDKMMTPVKAGVVQYDKSSPGTKYTTSYSGKVSPFQSLQELDENGLTKDGKIPSISYKTDHVTLGYDPNGRPISMEMMPKDVFEQNLVNTEKKKDQFQKLYNEWKQGNGIKSKYGTTEDDYWKRYYALKLVKDNDASHIFPENKEQKANITIRNEMGLPLTGKGSGGSESPINDLYKTIHDKVAEDHGKGFYTRTNSLPVDAQNSIIDFARKATGDNEIGNGDLIINMDNQGNIQIWRQRKDEVTEKPLPLGKKDFIGFLPEAGTNLKVQPNTKAKQEVVEKANKKTIKSTTDFIKKNQGALD